MTNPITQIHHITAICRDANLNIKFYTEVLGLRLVKQTVNFDAPEIYHFYYGDGEGRPGSLLTFFAWPDAPKGKIGAGQIACCALSIPVYALNYWQQRFHEFRIPFEAPEERLDEVVIRFRDPDGLDLELMASSVDDPRAPWQNGPVPSEYAIRGISKITLVEKYEDKTAETLTTLLGFYPVPRSAKYPHRFSTVPAPTPGGILDILSQPNTTRGQIGIGTIHHVAWRIGNGANQSAWQQTIANTGFEVTSIKNRKYFSSIYFREPGGVLFEIATDAPGLTVDEPETSLGSLLQLPEWLEAARMYIERVLPHLDLPRRIRTR